MSSSPDALQGLRVLELGQLIAGPFAGKTLADFGADVIKVEPVDGGDPLRRWRLLREGTSVWWEVQSRNKRSLALDLRQPDGQAAVRALAAQADVLIENFKPGTLEAWGLGWDALHALNPGLIMLRISGYGQTGPYRAKPGFGVLGEAIGRAAPPQRRTRPRAGARGREHRRHAGRAARRDRRADGAAPPRGERRPGADDRPGTLRERLQRHGEPAARVRRLRRRARRGGQRAARHRAQQRLPLRWRRLRAGGGQRRQHLPPPDGRHSPRRLGCRPRPGAQRRPRRARGRDRRRHRRLDFAAADRGRHRRARRGGGSGRPHLHRGRHRRRPAVPGARHDRADPNDVDGRPLKVPGIVPKLGATPGRLRTPAPRLGQHNDDVLGQSGWPARAAHDDEAC